MKAEDHEIIAGKDAAVLPAVSSDSSIQEFSVKKAKKVIMNSRKHTNGVI